MINRFEFFDFHNVLVRECHVYGNLKKLCAHTDIIKN